MAATPPRPASPTSQPNVVVPKSGHALQISPNLQALLEHDELTRRNSSSPTSVCYTTSPAFPISLPPPPPRKAQGCRKTGQREQEPFPTTRSKEEKRKKSGVVGYDCQWPDALPTTFAPDGSAAGQSMLASSSRPVTPNPYLNPTPNLGPINTPPHSDVDECPTPRPAEKMLPSEPRSESSRSTAGGRMSASDPSYRPSTAPNKVEKILWMGRDSLNLFSGSAKTGGSKRPESDRRYERAEGDDTDAVQDGQIRQVPAAPVQCVSGPASRFGESETATVLSSSSESSYLHSLQQGSKVEPTSETALTRSDSNKSVSNPNKEPSPAHPHPAAFLPRLSLPSIFMPHSSPSRPQPVDSVTGCDYLSFIDFFPPSMSDDSNSCTIPDNTQGISSSRRQPSISIPPSSLQSTSRRDSLISLASMKFAPPPSPTSITVPQPSPAYHRSDSSSSAATLSSMKFAPPTPSSERVLPTRLQPLSGPPSPYSPLEFAPPPNPLYEVIEKPSSSPAPELASDRGRRLKSKKRSTSSSPRIAHHPQSPLPPTTNELDANERADRIRRNRKLARVFGRMPGMEEPVTEPEEPRASKKLHSPSLAGLLTKQKNHRHAVSVSVSVKSRGMKTEPSTPWQTDDLCAPGDRRHSTPLATGSFTLYVGGEDGTVAKDPFDSSNLADLPDDASTRSFIDLSDEEVREDDVSTISFLSPHQHVHRRLHQSSSFPSLVESFDSEAQAEAERRRKREKLAKLHRCLGSSVPPEAVNGCLIGTPLPPLAIPEQADHEHWLREIKSAPPDEFDRGKEELDEREKALNVRRAQKMERVFGTPPPQVLFHSRPTRSTVPVSQPTSPTGQNPFVLTLDLPSSSRNPNRSAYMGKTVHRPGPSDSSICLLPRIEDTPQSSPSSFAQSFAESLEFQQILAQSSVYLNYQHSLNSLIDIIDRDDRKSLVELHRFLHGEADESPLDEEVPVNPRRASIAASFKSERRHSLPSSASMTSLSSEFTSPKISRFQIRRRQAAKLTNFFGVDYRELIHDILESIEKGVEDECKQGTLQPEEVEVLMHRVRSLRSINSLDHM